MTETTRYNREQYYVKWTLEKHLMFLALGATAIPWNNCDFQATVAATGGNVHMCAVAASSVAVRT